MELLKLLGIVIVIAGFALKLDSILVILVAAVVTALVGGLGPVTLLETLGSTFVANRSMAYLHHRDAGHRHAGAQRPA